MAQCMRPKASSWHSSAVTSLTLPLISPHALTRPTAVSRNGRSRASDQLANEPFRYPTAPQSHASLLRSDTPQLQMDLRVIPISESRPCSLMARRPNATTSLRGS